VPVATPLTSPGSGGPITVYFRTRFPYSQGFSGVSLYAENFVDDGAIFYLNGAQVGRIRMGVNATNFTSLAQTVNPEGQSFFLSIPTEALVSGENVMAVEVHQSSATSSDVIFGMALTALTARTNQPVLLDAARVAGGFSVTLSGVPGRTYALEAASILGDSWTRVVTFSNFTGQATFVDPAVPAAGRYYRGRLVR
jgi:hypothetical protein